MSSDEKLKDSKWYRSTVRKILTDVAYIGHRVHGRKQKETFHLPKKATDSDKWIIIESGTCSHQKTSAGYQSAGIESAGCICRK